MQVQEKHKIKPETAIEQNTCYKQAELPFLEKQPLKQVLSPKLKRRFRKLINELGYNPLDYGFKIDWFVNGRSLCFSKKINNRNILLNINSWNGTRYLEFYRTTYSSPIFKFKTFIDKRNFERCLKTAENYTPKSKKHASINGIFKFLGFIQYNSITCL